MWALNAAGEIEYMLLWYLVPLRCACLALDPAFSSITHHIRHIGLYVRHDENTRVYITWWTDDHQMRGHEDEVLRSIWRTFWPPGCTDGSPITSYLYRYRYLSLCGLIGFSFETELVYINVAYSNTCLYCTTDWWCQQMYWLVIVSRGPRRAPRPRPARARVVIII